MKRAFATAVLLVVMGVGISLMCESLGSLVSANAGRLHQWHCGLLLTLFGVAATSFFHFHAYLYLYKFQMFIVHWPEIIALVSFMTVYQASELCDTFCWMMLVAIYGGALIVVAGIDFLYHGYLTWYMNRHPSCLES